jgi:hypothetical protein
MDAYMDSYTLNIAAIVAAFILILVITFKMK